MLSALLGTGIARIGADGAFFTVQQLVNLDDIGHIGCRTHYAVYIRMLWMGTAKPPLKIVPIAAFSFSASLISTIP